MIEFHFVVNVQAVILSREFYYGMIVTIKSGL